MKKLKECPFCGCEYINVNKIRSTGNYYLECPDCRIETRLFKTLDEAIEQWNTRNREITICSECRYFRERNNDEAFCEHHCMTVDYDYFCAEGKRR